MTKAAGTKVESIIGELVSKVKERVKALKETAEAEGKKDSKLSKEQVRALLNEAWDNTSTSRLIDAALSEAAEELGV